MSYGKTAAALYDYLCCYGYSYKRQQTLGAHKIFYQIYIGSGNPMNIESFKMSAKVVTAVSVVSGVQNCDNDTDTDSDNDSKP